MAKLGVAITAYDKFEEARILVDILRKEFNNEYVIGFCSNHPDAKKISADWDINCFSSSRNISFIEPTTAESTMTDTSFARFLIQIRALDSILISCKALMKEDVDYIVHVHSDAWFLKEKSLAEIISGLNKRNKILAVRGNGLETISNPISNKNSSAFGMADDHFFFFEKESFKQNHVFDVKPEELFPHKYSVHGMLMSIFVVRLGLSKIWYYRFLKDCYGIRMKPLGVNSIKPFSFDPIYDFIHLNRGSFPGDSGKSLQACLLAKYMDNKRSDMIRDFIDRYYVDEEHLLKGLVELDDSLNKKLRHRLYDEKLISTERIILKQNILKNSNFIKDLIKNLSKKAKLRLIRLMENKIEDFNVKNVVELYSKKYKINDIENVNGGWTSIYD